MALLCGLISGFGTVGAEGVLNVVAVGIGHFVDVDFIQLYVDLYPIYPFALENDLLVGEIFVIIVLFYRERRKFLFIVVVGGI